MIGPGDDDDDKDSADASEAAMDAEDAAIANEPPDPEEYPPENIPDDD